MTVLLHCIPCYELLSLSLMPYLFSVKVPCGECKKLFNNTWFLHQHALRAHTGEKKKLSCPRKGCDKKFNRRFNLENHVLGDHDGKKPFRCAYAGCGKSFAMKVNLHFSLMTLNVGSNHTCSNLMLYSHADGLDFTWHWHLSTRGEWKFVCGAQSDGKLQKSKLIAAFLCSSTSKFLWIIQTCCMDYSLSGTIYYRDYPE